MSKNRDKALDARKPIGDVDTKERKAIGRSRQLDSDFYQEKYGKEFKLMWIVDEGGDLDRWLDSGAEPVKRESARKHDWEGLSNRSSSPYMRVVAGTNQGGDTLWQYLLMMEHSLYNDIKIQPDKDRQAEVRRAMGLGAQEGAAPMEAREVNTAGVKTYAPYNVDGTQGLNQEQTQDFNSIR